MAVSWTSRWPRMSTIHQWLCFGPLEGLTSRWFRRFCSRLDLSKASRLDCSQFSIDILHLLNTSRLDSSHLLIGDQFSDVSMASRFDGSYFSVGVFDLLKASHLNGSHFSVSVLDLSKTSCLDCSNFSVRILDLLK